MLSRHPLREGVLAGTLGATAIAVWTFAIDALTDRIGVTAALLGAWIYQALGLGFGGRGFPAHVVTWLVALFIGVTIIGVVASYLYNGAERKPSLAFGLIMLILVLELILLNLTGLASQNPIFGGRAWIYGLVGNILGAVVMGRFLWRSHHPEALWDWEHANDEHFHQAGGARKA